MFNMQIGRSDSSGNRKTTITLEDVLDSKNLDAAFRRVVRKGGAPGIDGVTVKELRKRWPELRKRLIRDIQKGEYRPSPVRSVEIPKIKGGTRRLGIPTVVDRIFQQAVAQQIMRVHDSMFHRRSFAYRPNRGVHVAVECFRNEIFGGKYWAAIMDIRNFFGRISHTLIAQRLGESMDADTLSLVEQFLRSGISINGKIEPTICGTPQGGPLSPVIANVVLDPLDRYLDSLGVLACRYSDDVAVCASSFTEGLEAFEIANDFLVTALDLEFKDVPEGQRVRIFNEIDLLGFSFRDDAHVSLGIAEARLPRLKARLCNHLEGYQGNSQAGLVKELNSIIRGWTQFYRIASIPNSVLLEFDVLVFELLAKRFPEKRSLCVRTMRDALSRFSAPPNLEDFGVRGFLNTFREQRPPFNGASPAGAWRRGPSR